MALYFSTQTSFSVRLAVKWWNHKVKCNCQQAILKNLRNFKHWKLTDHELFLAAEIMWSFPKSNCQQDSHSLVSFSLWKHILDTSSLSSHYLKWNIIHSYWRSLSCYIYGGKKKPPQNLVCPAVFTCNTLSKKIVSTHTEDSICFVNTTQSSDTC